jgi:hypothetical protein
MPFNNKKPTGESVYATLLPAINGIDVPFSDKISALLAIAGALAASGSDADKNIFLTQTMTTGNGLIEIMKAPEGTTDA